MVLLALLVEREQQVRQATQETLAQQAQKDRRMQVEPERPEPRVQLVTPATQERPEEQAQQILVREAAQATQVLRELLAEPAEPEQLVLLEILVTRETPEEPAERVELVGREQLATLVTLVTLDLLIRDPQEALVEQELQAILVTRETPEELAELVQEALVVRLEFQARLETLATLQTPEQLAELDPQVLQEIRGEPARRARLEQEVQLAQPDRLATLVIPVLMPIWATLD
jgi:hypothetical protein